MAGIVGIARKDEEGRVQEALAKIAHRGGTGARVQASSGATLGEVWPTAQAFYARGVEWYGVVLDGEIHNWSELAPHATCPLEALACAHRAEGAPVVAQLDGPFALAIAGAQGIFLARDLLGKSPLYYGRHKGDLCFASELKALAGWATDVKEFPPGHCYEPGQGLVRYAQLRTRPAVEGSSEQVATELRTRLESSVAKRMRHGEVGAWLSGGLDSATMTALASRLAPGVKTFGVGVDGASDLEYARRVADFVSATHHERLCTLEEMLEALPEVIYHLESFDALLVRSSVMNFLVGRLASQEVPAVLSGEGGDELFAGYAYLKGLDPADLPDELIDITGRLHNTALQRVDRCSAGHGLVARTGFLDRAVVDYAMAIPAEMKIGGDGAQVEKWILRRAMDGLLPDEVLERRKSKFWEGAGVGERLSAHADEVISDSEFASERALPGGVRLNTKEELLYYRIFREQFGGAVDPGLVGRTKGAPVAH